MPVQDYTVKWYEPSGPVRFEIVTDHTGWKPVAPRGVGDFRGCLQGTISSEPGYVRAWTLFGDDAGAFGGPSNIMALPEPAGVGLAVGLVLLIAFGGRRRGR